MTDIGIVKRGHEASQNDSTYYSIEFRYGGKPDKMIPARREEVMEYSNARDAKLKYVEVMSFLEKELDLANILVIDESTTSKKKKAKSTLPKRNKERDDKPLINKKKKEFVD